MPLAGELRFHMRGGKTGIFCRDEGADGDSLACRLSEGGGGGGRRNWLLTGLRRERLIEGEVVSLSSTGSGGRGRLLAAAAAGNGDSLPPVLLVVDTVNWS